MNNSLWKFKSNKKGLPFPFPGEVSYLDFSEKRFQASDSKVFIRPSFYIEAYIDPQPKSYTFPCIEDSCFLLYIKEGQARIKCGENIFLLTEGCGLLASADACFSITHKENPLSCLFFVLKGELLWELYRAQKKKVVPFTRYGFPDFEQRLDSLMKEYMQTSSPLLFDFSRHMDHLLSRIVHQSLYEKFDTVKNRHHTLMDAMSYMKEHCCEKLQVGDIAAAFGYSRSHFTRIFQAQFQESPKKYLLKLRTAHAEKLLVTSDLSIEGISQECGFNTPTHFIQTFRDIYEMTPLQYRKQMNEKSKSEYA